MLNPVSYTGIHADDFGSHTDRPHETPSIDHHGSLRGWVSREHLQEMMMMMMMVLCNTISTYQNIK